MKALSIFLLPGNDVPLPYQPEKFGSIEICRLKGIEKSMGGSRTAPTQESDDFPNMETRGLERRFILQKILDESFRLVNSDPQGVVKGLHVFPEGGLAPDYHLQPVTAAEFADPPEEVALQEIFDLTDLFFPALGADDFSYDFHPAGFLVPERRKSFSFTFLF
jgi:hypothetical protein